ncbi:MAG: hypothetical protein LKF80_02805 [Brevundimonas sp.]|jgi:hypothetical protein|uniref:hypothetical protein n=1 Tax=Brevundimonas sp. TaxID=1871086 RepID=UPI0025C12A2E|nr:hypothetical protein [Brevundimonas sp.]MCH4267315.1 hypothetical protein [Brevundimonas sp.]
MIPQGSCVDSEVRPEGDDDLLTRAEASAFLALMGVRLKPASLARIWSTSNNGPPCRHIRSKPYYPRGLLRDWARAQISEVRTGAPPAARGRGRA